MDAVKWHNLVQLDTNTEVLSSGLTCRVSKQSNLLGRIWIQLFGEGFDKVRLVSKIFAELQKPETQDLLKSKTEDELDQAIQKIDSLKNKFSSRAPSTDSTLDACKKIIQAAKEAVATRADVQFESFSFLMDPSNGITLESLSPCAPSAQRAASYNEVMQDLEQYPEEVRNEVRLALLSRGTALSTYDIIKVRQVANKLTLESFTARFSKEAVEEALGDYCNTLSISKKDFLQLINKGLKPFNADVIGKIRPILFVREGQFARALQSHFETVSALPGLGRDCALVTSIYALENIFTDSRVKGNDLYLAACRQFYMNGKDKMDPIAARSIISSTTQRLPKLNITKVRLAQLQSFCNSMHTFLVRYHEQMEKENAGKVRKQEFEAKQTVLLGKIGTISKDIEQLDGLISEKTKITERFISLNTALSDKSLSAGSRKRCEAEMSILSAQLSEEKYSFIESKKAEKNEELKITSEELAKLYENEKARAAELLAGRKAIETTPGFLRAHLRLVAKF